MEFGLEAKVDSLRFKMKLELVLVGINLVLLKGADLETDSNCRTMS